ncbi:hypothetical protein ACR6HW_08535 [Fusibacter sp. JL298sf-3]
MKKIHTKKVAIISLSTFVLLAGIVFIRMRLSAQDKKHFDLKDHIAYTWEDASGTIVLNTSDAFETYHFAYTLQNESLSSMTTVYVDREIRLTFDRNSVIYYDVMDGYEMSLDRGEIHMEKALQDAIDITGYFFTTPETYKLQSEVAFKSTPNDLIAKGETAESLIDYATLILYKEGVVIERQKLEKMPFERYYLTLNIEKIADQSLADFNETPILREEV